MAAMEGVREAHMTVQGAVRQFRVPKTSLLLRLNGKVSVNAIAGRLPVPKKEEEDEILETCQLFAEWGYGLRKADVRAICAEFCCKLKRHNPFNEDVPGDDWWSGFILRHPSLVQRRPQELQMVRARCSKVEVVNHWFIQCLKPTLDSLNLHEETE